MQSKGKKEMLLVGYGKGVSKKTGKPYFKVDVIKTASPLLQQNGQVGRVAGTEFIPEEVYNTLTPKMLDKEIDFEHYVDGRFVQVTGIKVL